MEILQGFVDAVVGILHRTQLTLEQDGLLTGRTM